MLHGPPCDVLHARVGRTVRTVLTSERRDTRTHQNASAGVRCGGAEEYAISDRQTRTMNSRLTGLAANPERRRFVSHSPEDAFCHDAKREAQSEPSYPHVLRATSTCYFSSIPTAPLRAR
jgi:hypothetical protein